MCDLFLTVALEHFLSGKRRYHDCCLFVLSVDIAIVVCLQTIVIVVLPAIYYIYIVFSNFILSLLFMRLLIVS